MQLATRWKDRASLQRSSADVGLARRVLTHLLIDDNATVVGGIPFAKTYSIAEMLYALRSIDHKAEGRLTVGQKQ